MESVKSLIEFLIENKEEIALLLLTLISVAEMVVRLTPTVKDDGAVERVGAIIRKVLDFFKIPNVKK